MFFLKAFGVAKPHLVTCRAFRRDVVCFVSCLQAWFQKQSIALIHSMINLILKRLTSSRSWIGHDRPWSKNVPRQSCVDNRPHSSQTTRPRRRRWVFSDDWSRIDCEPTWCRPMSVKFLCDISVPPLCCGISRAGCVQRTPLDDVGKSFQVLWIAHTASSPHRRSSTTLVRFFEVPSWALTRLDNVVEVGFRVLPLHSTTSVRFFPDSIYNRSWSQQRALTPLDDVVEFLIPADPYSTRRRRWGFWDPNGPLQHSTTSLRFFWG
jgi:hypothetical protein